MRTTIDLPADLHALTTQLARSSGRTLSQAVSTLLREALHEPGAAELRPDPLTGLRILHSDRRLTSADVADLLDE